MADQESDPGFKIVDRRVRADDVAPPGKPAVAPPERPEEKGPAEGVPEPSLIGLFDMLGTSCLLALGDVTDPGAPPTGPDLQQAGDLIDLLRLLRRKTEGNRDPEESEVLDQLIYDLQMRFISARARSG